MRRYLVKCLYDYSQVVRREINLDHSKNNVPKEYPCIVVVGYSGAGWDELIFIYPSEFN